MDPRLQLDQPPFLALPFRRRRSTSSSSNHSHPFLPPNLLGADMALPALSRTSPPAVIASIGLMAPFSPPPFPPSPPPAAAAAPVSSSSASNPYFSLIMSASSFCRLLCLIHTYVSATEEKISPGHFPIKTCPALNTPSKTPFAMGRSGAPQFLACPKIFGEVSGGAREYAKKDPERPFHASLVVRLARCSKPPF